MTIKCVIIILLYYYLSIKIMKNFYIINGRVSINIYKMAIKCIIIILLLFKYYNNGEYE